MNKPSCPIELKASEVLAKFHETMRLNMIGNYSKKSLISVIEIIIRNKNEERVVKSSRSTSCGIWHRVDKRNKTGITNSKMLRAIPNSVSGTRSGKRGLLGSRRPSEGPRVSVS
ncbi:unnamed protein product [Linum trigynum]|uniref:Uncharacterized protein n=1 Tax=Linum trigynum TaxID=586398 RepID=A0AAV2CN87_9ROSI